MAATSSGLRAASHAEIGRSPMKSWGKSPEFSGENHPMSGENQQNIQGKSPNMSLWKCGKLANKKLEEFITMDASKNVRDLTNVTWSLASPPEWRITPMNSWCSWIYHQSIGPIEKSFMAWAFFALLENWSPNPLVISHGGDYEFSSKKKTKPWIKLDLLKWKNVSSPAPSSVSVPRHVSGLRFSPLTMQRPLCHSVFLSWSQTCLVSMTMPQPLRDVHLWVGFLVDQQIIMANHRYAEGWWDNHGIIMGDL